MPLEIPSSFFLGFFPSIQFFPVAVCSFFGCVSGVTLIEVKWYLFFSGRTRKNFLYEVHTKGYRLTDFLSEGKMRKRSEMYALCLYAFNTVFCGTFEIRPFWHWISIIFALCGTNIVRYTVFFIISYSQHIFRPLTLSYTISREKNKYTKGEEKKHRWNRKVSLFFHFSVTCGYVLNKYREKNHSFGPLWRRAMLVCNHGNNINETKVQAKLGFETSCSFRWYVSYFTNGISGKFDPDSGTLWMPNKILIRYEFTYQWLRFGWFVIFVKRTNDIGIYAIWW